MPFATDDRRLIHRWYLRANVRIIKFSRSCVRIYGEKLAKGTRQALPNTPKPRTKLNRRRRRRQERSGRTKNKTVVKKGKKTGGRGEKEGGGIRGRFPTLSTGRVSAGLRPRSRILMGRRHLVLLCRYPLPANPMSCHPFA